MMSTLGRLALDTTCNLYCKAIIRYTVKHFVELMCTFTGVFNQIFKSCLCRHIAMRKRGRERKADFYNLACTSMWWLHLKRSPARYFPQEGTCRVEYVGSAMEARLSKSSIAKLALLRRDKPFDLCFSDEV